MHLHLGANSSTERWSTQMKLQADIDCYSHEMHTADSAALSVLHIL